MPVDVGFFLGFFGAGGWGMWSLLAFTGGVDVEGSLLSYPYWLSSSATFVSTTAF